MNQSYDEQPVSQSKATLRAALLTYPGNLQEALRRVRDNPQNTLFGVTQTIPSPAVTKALASARPDFIWIDTEHSTFDRLSLNDAIHAAQHHSEGHTLAIVRALDAGASGIIIPHCESAEEVKQIIAKVYYPPIGHRSYNPWTFTPGVSDASLYEDDAYNIKTYNRHVVVIPQIETVKGIENVEEISSLEGVGSLMFGAGDFSIDAGIPLPTSATPHPTLAEAAEKFSAAGKKYGKPLFG
ncbi:uncharacterized protein BHQ10_002860 [Talaromyces amestolkiae]|uniref:HpcH/HpaI aldolase/citrate lyase domain-containing protein n=1 Tax=Talaromyces amestolkiae TaxID=1196081 RepID=A0A364KTH2_TALAM|nr:uncharacterized protein BHQ10_002860 [Talaromyces amestolkiae]RAO66848.1 hypothetical protein BHQ10_002860 [Talaromyces amestolkiae]